MVPVYFQASRWLRRYLQKPAFTDGYKLSAVNDYADAILAGLTGPAPAAPPIKKVGVADLPYRNLTYIDPAWIGGRDLLESACGFPGPRADEAGKYNGRANYAVLQTGFHELFTRDDDFRRADGVSLFSIIDTDSAHHFSAPLVERAVRTADPGRLGGNPTRAMIVVNFDAHTDYGASAGAGDTVTCQSWGQFVANTVNGVYAYQLADAYIRFGGNPGLADVPDWTRGEWHEANARYVTQRIEYAAADDALGAQLDAACKKITETTGKTDFDVYVSLDRDVLQRNFSQYFDGPFPAADGINGVKHCLTYLAGKHARIIGFDITGLPTHPGGIRGAAGEFSVTEAMALADQQIIDLWRHVVPL